MRGLEDIKSSVVYMAFGNTHDLDDMRLENKHDLGKHIWPRRTDV